MTQTDLANAMNARGHVFRQQTVQKIESGDRSLQFDEAAEIADILGLPLDRLTQGSSAVESLSDIYGHAAALAEASGKARAFVEQWLDLQANIPAYLRLAAGVDAKRELTERDREVFEEAVSALQRWAAIDSADALLAQLQLAHRLPRHDEQRGG